jgi:hypothetical protein
VRHGFLAAAVAEWVVVAAGSGVIGNLVSDLLKAPLARVKKLWERRTADLRLRPVRILWAALGVCAVTTAYWRYREMPATGSGRGMWIAVTGALLLVAGYCGARSFGRATAEQMASSRGPGGVDRFAAGDQPLSSWLDREPVIVHLASLNHQIGDAQGRLAEYYDMQCRQQGFYHHEPLLRIILSDLDRIAVTATDLSETFGFPQDRSRYVVPEAAVPALMRVQREGRDAIHRSQDSYESLVAHLFDELSTSRLLFEAMIADLFRATRTLDALLAQHLLAAPRYLMRDVVAYFNAAFERAADLKTAFAVAHGAACPITFEVVIADLRRIAMVLSEIEPIVRFDEATQAGSR